MNTFFTADYHLGEDRFAIMNRPFSSQQEMVDVLVKNHNSLVSADDLVYHLGDVCYSKAPEFLPQISKFNGRKILVRGNHDREFTDNDLEPYFEKIVTEGDGIDCLFYREVHEETIADYLYLTHYPTRAKKDIFNLVGHIHSSWRVQLNMLNVGVDVNHFFPVSIEDVKFAQSAISNYYDEDVWVAYKESNIKYLNIRGKKGNYFEGI